jgi:alpha/beta superfamily hydrolase
VFEKICSKAFKNKMQISINMPFSASLNQIQGDAICVRDIKVKCKSARARNIAASQQNQRVHFFYEYIVVDVMRADCVRLTAEHFSN